MKLSMPVGSAVAALALLGGACGSQPDATGASPSAGDVSTLLARPLHLPKLSAGAACPVTPPSSLRLAVSTPRGGPHFYIGGPNPQGGFAFNKTVYELVGAKGPVLLRGARLDATGALAFSALPANRGDIGETLTSAGGVTATFYAAAVSPGAAQPDGTTTDVFYLYPKTPGCYALQADATSFEAVVVLVASPG